MVSKDWALPGGTNHFKTRSILASGPLGHTVSISSMTIFLRSLWTFWVVFVLSSKISARALGSTHGTGRAVFRWVQIPEVTARFFGSCFDENLPSWKLTLPKKLMLSGCIFLESLSEAQLALLKELDIFWRPVVGRL